MTDDSEAVWELADVVDELVHATRFSGVVTVDTGDEAVYEVCSGYAHRGFNVPNSIDTQFAMASGSKGFTALGVMQLVQEGRLDLDTVLRELIGDDLPLIADSVSLRHLLTHTSGIGDYLDEADDWNPEDYVLSVPPHTLTTTASFLPLLDGLRQESPPGESFAYSNAGLVILALVLERVTGETFHDRIGRIVLEPAGMRDTAYFRLDELPARAAVGYLSDESDRVNTLHLPVRGNGDGGAFTTASDMHRFWRSLFGGRILSPPTVQQMVRPYSNVPEENMRYGMGFWLHRESSAVILEGCDAGVSFRSTHEPESETTVTVLSNTSEGAWPVVRATLGMTEELAATGPSLP